MDIIQWVIYILMVSCVLVLAYEGRRIINGNDIPMRRKLKEQQNRFWGRVERIISRVRFLDGIKKQLSLKLGVINSSPEENNTRRISKLMSALTLASSAVFILVIERLGTWYVVLVTAVVVFCLPYLLISMILDILCSLPQKQFPSAVNVFITKYTTFKNKDGALKNTYQELKNPIRYEFKRLSRATAGKSGIEGAVEGFKKRMDYLWADVFGELLLINHYLVRDIGPMLQEFSILMARDQVLEANKRAEISGTRFTNFFLAGATAGALLFNLMYFKEEAYYIYFQSYAGTATLSIAGGVMVICLLLTLYFEKY